MGTRRDQSGSSAGLSGEMWRAVFESAPVGMALVSIDPPPYGRVVEVNDALAQTFGCARDEVEQILATRDAASYSHPDDVNVGLQETRRLLDGEIDSFEIEKRFVRRDGTPIWARLNSSLIRDGDGEPLYRVLQIRDVTAQRHTEESLRASERKLAEAQAAGRVGTWEWDIRTGVVTWSDELCRIYDVERAPATFEDYLALLHPDDRTHVDATVRHALETGEPYEFEARRVAADGSISVMACRGEPILDDRGRPARLVGVGADVTDRTRAEEELRRSEERYRTIVEAAREGVGMLDAEDRLSFANARFAHMLDYEVEEMVGRPFQDFVHPTHLEAAKDRNEKRHRGESTLAEVCLRRKDGGELWTLMSSSPLMTDRGEYAGTISMATDITDRRKAQEQSRLLAAVVNSSTDAILAKTLDGHVKAWNAAAERMTGYSAAEMVGRDTRQLIPEERWHEIDDIRAELEAGRSVTGFETQRLAKDGTVLDLSLTVSPLRDADGKVIGSAMIARDIGERKRAARELEAREKHFRAVWDNALEAMIVFDENARFVDVNPAAAALIGVPRERIHGRSVDEVLPSAWAREFKERGADLLATRRDLRGEFTAPDAEGESRCLQYGATADFVPGRHLVVLRDVTEQRRAIDELRDSEERYRRIVDTAIEGIWLADADGILTFANSAMASMIDRHVDELVGRPVGEFLDEESAAKIPSVIEGFEGPSGQHEFTLVARDGSPIHTRVSVNVLRNEDGSLAGALGMVSDMSAQVAAERERQELEEQMNQSQRLEGIGRLAGGVAHDFNNLLAIILNYASFAIESLGDRPDVRHDVEEIRRAAESAASLTEQLLVFSRRDLPRTATIDLGSILEDTARLLRRTIGEDIVLSLEIERDLRPVCADPGHIEQVLLNLAVNARDAMPHGGRLRVGLRNVSIAAGIGGGAEPGEFVVLEVSDSGTGMDPDALEHAFEPFFTTKPRGKGTGLGLSTVYGIVTRAGGRVELDSQVGEGTTVRAYFPAAPEAERPEPPAVEPGGVEATNHDAATVLVVEDEPAVRRVATRILSERGYRVLEAESAEEALRLPVWGGHDVDVVLVDAVLPGMSGRELVDRLRESRSGLRAVFMSGYTDDMVMLGISEREELFVGKPFSADELATQVAHALAQVPGRAA